MSLVKRETYDAVSTLNGLLRYTVAACSTLSDMVVAHDDSREELSNNEDMRINYTLVDMSNVITKISPYIIPLTSEVNMYEASKVFIELMIDSIYQYGMEVEDAQYAISELHRLLMTDSTSVAEAYDTVDKDPYLAGSSILDLLQLFFDIGDRYRAEMTTSGNVCTAFLHPSFISGPDSISVLMSIMLMEEISSASAIGGWIDIHSGKLLLVDDYSNIHDV